MGQRHQVFIKTNNPNYGKKNEKATIGGWVKDKFTLDPRTQKALGGRKHTVLAYHHQWLYGRSAAFIAHKLMALALSFKKDGTYESDYNHPLAPKFNKTFTMVLEKAGEFFKYYMGIITPGENFPRGVGFENFIFLNPDEPVMRERFDHGDNNDGITIVDMIEKKYCLMNIYDHNYADEGDVSENVDDLPHLTPVSAVDYAKAYYPTEKNKLSKYTREEKCKGDPKKIQELLHDNRGHIIEIELMFEGMEVLSLDEVKAIFPKVFEEKTVKV